MTTVKTAAQLRKIYGRRIDGTVGLLHRDVLIDASDLAQLLDMAEEAEEVDANVLQWHHLALLHGYNELARKAETLGEKVYCRMAVHEQERQLTLLGVTVTKDTGDVGPTVLTLPHRSPHIEFCAHDIELMRTAVAVHDTKMAETTKKSKDG